MFKTDYKLSYHSKWNQFFENKLKPLIKLKLGRGYTHVCFKYITAIFVKK